MIDEIIDAYLAHNPAHAVSLGLHAFDGQVCPHAEREARVRTLRDQQRRLVAAPVPAEGTLPWLDYRLALGQVEHELFELDERRAWQKNPMHYVNDLDVSAYLKRDYAPLAERLDAARRQLSAAPALLEHARSVLEPPFPVSFLEMSRTLYQGTVEFLTEDLARAAAPLREKSGALGEAVDAAVAAIRRFLDWLDRQVPESGTPFAIGKAAFGRLLATAEQVTTPVDDLLRQADADLERNLDRMARAAARIDRSKTVAEVMRDISRDHPSADGLVPETEAMLESIRQFVIDHDLVTVPSEERCRVLETPGFMRWAFAFMDGAGPYEEKARDSYYYVTPPEKTWAPERIEEWLTKFEYGTLKVVSVHEAWPGHFLHNLHYRNAPSRATRTFGAYSFWEGWAHYTEAMMLEEGYGGDDPRIEVAQLAEALLRNVRYVVAIRMHTQDMTVEEATRFFMKYAYMEETTARSEAVRGTFDPGYGNYTLGKLLCLDLRTRVKAQEGAGFSLRRFHDRVLAYGAPPWPLLVPFFSSTPAPGG